MAALFIESVVCWKSLRGKAFQETHRFVVIKKGEWAKFGYFYWGRNIDWSEYQQVILMENDQVLRCAEERKLTITSDGQTTVHDYSNRKSSS